MYIIIKCNMRSVCVCVCEFRWRWWLRQRSVADSDHRGDVAVYRDSGAAGRACCLPASSCAPVQTQASSPLRHSLPAQTVSTLRRLNNNKDETNLPQGGTACLYSPADITVPAVWLQFAIAWLGVDPQISPFPRGQGQRPHLTRCVVGPHKCTCQMASTSVERFKQGHECDRRQTDRQTDHATKKCVATGGIACASAVSSDNI